MKILRLLSALCALAIPASAQLIDYRSLGPTYFGSNTIGGVKGIVTGMMGTNSVDGSITNRNQSLGKVSIAGTNAVITADNGTSGGWLFKGQANGTNYLTIYTNGAFGMGNQDALDNYWGPVGFAGESFVSVRDITRGDQNWNELEFATVGESNIRGAINMLFKTNHSDCQWYYNENNSTNRRNVLIQAHLDDTKIRIFNSQIDTARADLMSFLPDQPASQVGPSYKFNTVNYMTNTATTSPLIAVQNFSTNKFLIMPDARLYWGANATLGYTPPPAYGGANSILSDTTGAGVLAWTNIAAIVTNNQARIGPGTPKFIPQFITPTNVTDSSVHQVETNQWNWNVRTNYAANTNSFTNKFYGEFTSTNNFQGMYMVVNPPAGGLYNGIFSMRGSGDARAQNKFNLWDSWVVNGIGSGAGTDAAGDWLPLNDNTENIGSGSQRVHDFFAGRIYIATPLSSGPQWGDSVGGTGMGLTTDATMIQFFRNTGITAAFNKERNAGTLQFDLAGNLLGFGSGISNTAAYFQDSGVAGLIGLGTNNSTTAPLRVGFMPRSANGTDKGGAQMVLLGGAGTGTGRGGDIAFGTARPSTTGLTVNSYTTNFFIAANPVTLTESSATLVFSVALDTNKSIGMMVTATTVANDGSVYQTVMEQFAISAAVDAAYTPVVSASAPIATYQRSGTLTTTWTAVQNAGVIDVKCNAVSSLTQTTLKVLGYQVVINTDGTAVISPQ